MQFTFRTMCGEAKHDHTGKTGSKYVTQRIYYLHYKCVYCICSHCNRLQKQTNRKHSDQYNAIESCLSGQEINRYMEIEFETKKNKWVEGKKPERK